MIEMPLRTIPDFRVYARTKAKDLARPERQAFLDSINWAREQSACRLLLACLEDVEEEVAEAWRVRDVEHSLLEGLTKIRDMKPTMFSMHPKLDARPTVGGQLELFPDFPAGPDRPFELKINRWPKSNAANVFFAEFLREALAHTGGNRTKAAKLAGISVRTMRNWLTRAKQDCPEEMDLLT